MGYDQENRRKLYELTFRPFPGLLVRCRKPGFAAFELLSDAVLALGDDFAGRGLAGEEQIYWWGKLFRAFARSLVAWNLSDRGRAVPATKRGVLDQDHDFLLQVVRSWYYTVVLHQEVAEPAASSAPVAAPEPEPEVDEAERLLATIPVGDVEPEPVPA